MIIKLEKGILTAIPETDIDRVRIVAWSAEMGGMLPMEVGEIRTEPQKIQIERTPKKGMFCNYCHSKEHISRDCPKPYAYHRKEDTGKRGYLRQCRLCPRKFHGARGIGIHLSKEHGVGSIKNQLAIERKERKNGLRPEVSPISPLSPERREGFPAHSE